MTPVLRFALPLLALGPYASLTVLAVVQGLTEFLPVSSSGHLVLGQAVLGIGEGSLLEDVALHVGTLLAVLFFYRADVGRLATGFFRQGAQGNTARSYVGLLVLGNVPAGLVGVLFKDRIEVVFDDVASVLVAMTATAAVLVATRWLPRRDRPLTPGRALLIGVAQAVAILPGCSRSGWTIATGLALGLAPVEAARFSFLLSVPAILGAALLQAIDIEAAHTPWGALLLGVVVSALTGLVCLGLLVRLVRRMALHHFAWYLLAVVLVGTVALTR